MCYFVFDNGIDNCLCIVGRATQDSLCLKVEILGDGRFNRDKSRYKQVNIIFKVNNIDKILSNIQNFVAVIKKPRLRYINFALSLPIGIHVLTAPPPGVDVYLHNDSLGTAFPRIVKLYLCQARLSLKATTSIHKCQDPLAQENFIDTP